VADLINFNFCFLDLDHSLHVLSHVTQHGFDYHFDVKTDPPQLSNNEGESEYRPADMGEK
jgi:hypothetical protein